MKKTGFIITFCILIVSCVPRHQEVNFKNISFEILNEMRQQDSKEAFPDLLQGLYNFDIVDSLFYVSEESYLCVLELNEIVLPPNNTIKLLDESIRDIYEMIYPYINWIEGQKTNFEERAICMEYLLPFENLVYRGFCSIVRSDEKIILIIYTKEGDSDINNDIKFTVV